jgi:hypothetical protein
MHLLVFVLGAAAALSVSRLAWSFLCMWVLNMQPCNVDDDDDVQWSQTHLFHKGEWRTLSLNDNSTPTVLTNDPKMNFVFRTAPTLRAKDMKNGMFAEELKTRTYGETCHRGNHEEMLHVARENKLFFDCGDTITQEQILQLTTEEDVIVLMLVHKPQSYLYVQYIFRRNGMLYCHNYTCDNE